MKEDPNKSAWSLEVGMYVGILLGIRVYEEEHCVTHVLYVPFFDIALTIYK